MKLKNTKITIIALTVLLIGGCEKYWGDKTDLDFIEVPIFQPREIAYVPIQPYVTNLMKPTSIVAGFDELLYVVDEGSEQIICYDESLRELSRFNLPGVTFVTQDRRLDLLAIGTTDTVINGVNFQLSTVFRITLLGTSGYGLQHARITHRSIHPFYFKNSFSTSDGIVRFTNIGVMGNNLDQNRNNQYYVSRTGPSANNAGQGPDDAILLFDNQDKYVTPISVSTSGGLFNNFFKNPYGITTLAKPPQITASNSPDFIFTSTNPSTPLKVMYIEFVEAEFGAEFRPVIFTVSDPLAESFLNSPDRFTSPRGITIAGDQTRFIFVTDSDRDSVYQFTANGLEGVPPPPGAESPNYVRASFGGTGVGPLQFNQPRGIAYFRKILYVCDSGNGRISRFKLTTDFD